MVRMLVHLRNTNTHKHPETNRKKDLQNKKNSINIKLSAILIIHEVLGILTSIYLKYCKSPYSFLRINNRSSDELKDW